MQAIVFHYVNEKDDSHFLSMGWLIEHEKILWGLGLSIDKNIFNFPIIGYVVMDGKIRYQSLIHDIYFNITKELEYRYKPISWHDSEEPFKTHFLITNFHPCGPFEISSFIKKNGEPLKDGFRGYSQVIEKGKEPRYNIIEIKDIIKNKYKEQYIFDSLHEIGSHKIIDISNPDYYKIQYKSNNVINIKYDDLFSIYCKLYDMKYLNNQYMENHWNDKDLLSEWKMWHAPGSAIMAELPVIDNTIINDKGTLKINIRKEVLL